MYSVGLNAMKMYLVTGAGISFDGIETQAVQWAVSGVTLVLLFMLAKNFFAKAFGQMIFTVGVGSFAVYVINNPDKVFAALGKIIGTVFN